MKLNITKDWCEKMARREAGAEVAAGLLAIDPVFNESVSEDSSDEARFVLQRFIELGRRSKELSVEQLAEEADIEISELINIESDIHHLPEPRTLYQLANVFDVSQGKLMELSGLTNAKDGDYLEDAVRYAARSESIAKLTPEEQSALDGLVSVLSKQ